jgi:hypothetical protein
LQPYALYPLKDYFSGELNAVKPFLNSPPQVVPIRPPLSRPTEFQTPWEKSGLIQRKGRRWQVRRGPAIFFSVCFRRT